jgi:hypothetical protein
MRRLAAVLVVVLGALVLPQASAAAGTQGGDGGGFPEITGCISGADHLLVDVVVDESASLRETDPAAERVHGITTAVDSLQQLAATAPRTLDVEVGLSTFARGFDTLVGWDRLTARSADTLRSTVARQLPGRASGDATDYRQALLGAKSSLETRATQLGDPDACKVVLLFTDGGLDVDADTAAAADQLCKTGGIADQMHRAGIFVVAVALFRPGSDVTETHRQQLRAVATGTGRGVSCGTTPIATDLASGVYLPAGDPAALRRLFAGAGALVAGATAGTTYSCPGARCPAGTLRLTMDRGVAGLRMVAQGDGRLGIVSPHGTPVRLTPGVARTVDGAQVRLVARSGLATVDVSYPSQLTRPAVWTLRTSTASTVETYWFWGAHLAAQTTRVTAGTTTPVVFRLVDRDGAAVDTSAYERLTAQVTVGDRTQPASLRRDGTVSADVRLGSEHLPSTMTATAQVSARTTPSGVALGPVAATRRLTVVLPQAFPAVSPDRLDFGKVEGVEPSTTDLRLQGSPLGPTMVCLTGSRTVLPGDDGAVGSLVRPDRRCVALGTGEDGTMSLSLTPTEVADGLAEGTVTLRLDAAAGQGSVDLDVPVAAALVRPVDQGRRLGLLAALVGVALAAPLLLLFGANYLLLGRFRIKAGARAAVVPVTITPTGMRRTSGGALVEPEDLRNLAPTKRRGVVAVDVQGRVRLRARRIFSLRHPAGVARSAQGRTLVSAVGPRVATGPARGEAPVALGTVDAAIVIVDPATSPTEAPGRLLVVVPPRVEAAEAAERAVPLTGWDGWGDLLEANAQHTRRRTGEPGASTASVPPAAVSTDDLLPPPWPGSSSAAAAARPDPRAPAWPPPSPVATTDDPGLPPLPDFLK